MDVGRVNSRTVAVDCGVPPAACRGLGCKEKKAFVGVKGPWSPPAWSQAIWRKSVSSVLCVCVFVSDSVQSQLDREFQKECVTLKLAAEIILQLLLIGFSVNKAFIDQKKSLNTRTPVSV